ncbi:MAG: DNA-binding protein WhiA [Synergistaceae bacterium]|nr:DNA-binding protein WhiA [Synergistaceae bacterium]
MLSISELLWDEWSSFKYDEPDKFAGYQAECLGILAGVLSSKGVYYLKIKTAKRLIKIFKYFKPVGGVRLEPEEFNIAKMLEFDNLLKVKRPKVKLADMPGRDELLNLALNSQASWPWMRGLFGSCGSFYLTKSGFYLVLRIINEAVALKAEKFLNNKKWSRRYFRGAHELILRDQEEVVTFLSNIELTGAALELEHKVIMRLMRDQANKASNCDTANIMRATQAAFKQIELAKKFMDDAELINNLPDKLRELVMIRLENPEANLSELGEKLSPPVSKSTVKYRWAKLSNYIK